MPVSFSPDDAIKGGLEVNDIDGVLKLHAQPFQSPYTTPSGYQTGCCLVGTVTDREGSEHLVFWSAGKSEAYEVLDGGRQIEHRKGNKGISDQSNLILLVQEAINAGMPKSAIGDDIMFLDGIDAHWVQKPALYQGDEGDAPQQQGQQKKKGPRTVAVPSKMFTQWDAKGNRVAGKAAAAGSSKKTTAKAAEVAGDVDQEAVTDIAGVLISTFVEKEPGKEYKMAAMWQGRTLKAVQEWPSGYDKCNEPTQKAIVQKLRDKEFLQEYGFAIATNGGITVGKLE